MRDMGLDSSSHVQLVYTAPIPKRPSFTQHMFLLRIFSSWSVLFQWCIHVFCAHAMLFLTLSFCNGTWSVGLSCLPLCSYSPGWLFLGVFWFHMNFKILFSSSVRNTIGLLIGIVLNLYIKFESMLILIRLVLSPRNKS